MLVTYLVRLGGERCDQIYTFFRLIRGVEEFFCMDLGFGSRASPFQDVQIYNDESDPVNFGPSHIGEMIHSGYIFHEDLFRVKNNTMKALEIVDVHNVLAEDFLFGNGYADGFAGDHPMNVMF